MSVNLCRTPMPLSEFCEMLNALWGMDFKFYLSRHWICMASPMLTGSGVHLLVVLQPVIVCFLAPIAFLGLLRDNPLLPNLVQKQSTGHLFPSRLNSHGLHSLHTFCEMLVFVVTNHPSYSLITLVLFISLLILWSMRAHKAYRDRLSFCAGKSGVGWSHYQVCLLFWPGWGYIYQISH